jgi:nicotinamide mononucleotide (NMN) deamidase PncC
MASIVALPASLAIGNRRRVKVRLLGIIGKVAWVDVAEVGRAGQNDGMHDDAIAAIHRSGRPFVIALTGGGSGVIGRLLRVPGGSRSVLEAVVPYSWNALIDWLGGKPDQACSAETARAMAMASWMRARKLAEGTPVEQLLGVGSTASLASDRPKRGAHRLFAAFQTADATHTISVEFEKGARSRAEEEDLCVELLLAALAQKCDVPRDAHPGLALRETLVTQTTKALPEWRELMLGERDVVAGNAHDQAPRAILSGSFHPRHAGHVEMMRVAAERLGVQPAYEISIINVDKPPLDYTSIDERVRQFVDEPYYLTRAPTFVEKAALFPGATFLVGADTIVRIGLPKYYGDDPAARDAAIASIAAHDCRFLVFGRVAGQDFQTLDALSLPPALRALCDQISEHEFRADVSSTMLRQQEQQQQ